MRTGLTKQETLSHSRWQIVYSKIPCRMEAGAGALHRSGTADQGKEQGAQIAGCREKGIANIPCETPQGAGCPHCRANGRIGGAAFRKGTPFAKI